jgi:hypothetical protein
MIATTVTSTPVRALLMAWATIARQEANMNGQHDSRDLKVFLDCDAWLEDEIKPEMDFVEYVDNRQEADVCMTVMPDSSYGTVRHYRVRFAGAGRFAMIEASARLHLPKRQLARFPRLRSAGPEIATA